MALRMLVGLGDCWTTLCLWMHKATLCSSVVGTRQAKNKKKRQSQCRPRSRKQSQTSKLTSANTTTKSNTAGKTCQTGSSQKKSTTKHIAKTWHSLMAHVKP